MSIDMRLIRCAASLAEHGSFTRAADALDIAQPTLSRGISDLEANVGLPLFTRRRHGVEPTDFGYLFLKQAAAVSAQVADLEREVALAKGLHKGELAVGFSVYVAEMLLPQALPRFVSAHPAVRVRIRVDSPEALGRALRQSTLDVVVGDSTILEGDESIDTFESLAPIKAHLFARAGHPLAAAGESLPFPAIECPTVPLAIATMVATDAVMLATLGTVKHELARRSIVPVFRES